MKKKIIYQPKQQHKILDCLIIGAGPAGLLAGIYLARFRRNVVLIENGLSRASYIPLSHNYPGAKEGISGIAILKRLKKQIKGYQISIYKDTVLSVSKRKNTFQIYSEKQVYHAKNIILATGMSNHEPNIPAIKQAFLKGLIRHCMLCDAYEVIDKKVAILGAGRHAMAELLFMLRYSHHIDLFTLGGSVPSQMNCKKIFNKFGINVYTNSIKSIDMMNNQVYIDYPGKKKPLVYDVVYSAMGSFANSTLAKNLHAKLGKNRCVITDSDQQSSIAGFYAIGDVAMGLKQIVTAFGHAANAASAIHERLQKTEQC